MPSSTKLSQTPITATQISLLARLRCARTGSGEATKSPINLQILAAASGSVKLHLRRVQSPLGEPLALSKEVDPDAAVAASTDEGAVEPLTRKLARAAAWFAMQQPSPEH
jgi:hypothetical protein